MEQVVEYLPLLAWLVAAGVGAGLMAGLLGVGGGIVMVPAMAAVFQIIGMPSEIIMHVAVATSLAVIVPTGLSSARSHAKRGAVAKDLLIMWAPAMVIAAFVGGVTAGFLFGAGNEPNFWRYGVLHCCQLGGADSAKADGKFGRL